MSCRLLMSAALWLAAGYSIALADRPVTDNERAKLQAAMKAEGCSGGRMEYDDGRFEVDNATCKGRRYDLSFDAQFKLVRKDEED